MSAAMMNNNTAKEQYELVSNGELVAIAEYGLADGVITFTHTEVLPQYASEGYASELVKQALDDVSQQGWNVVPACSFIASFISKHPEYEKLVSDR